MSHLTAEQFTEFFTALWDKEPFPWQKRLATQVCTSGWPGCLDLPTASGKTASVDIALFAMAVSGGGPRRIFLVVDRRVIVDAAFERMTAIARKLADAPAGILRTVADRLRGMSESEEPVTAYALRGGIYRDDSWVRSPLQPTLIASTVDQVGSRLLFRGYGASDNTLSMHAALVANDSLILLDEAHCSRAFAETLHRVRDYRGWSEDGFATPFAFVEMTATPAREDTNRFQLDEDDLNHPVLRRRLFASKPVELVISKARLKDAAKLASDMANEALSVSRKDGVKRIAVMVNRVQTAQRVLQALLEQGCRAHLLIGRMRPVDRAELPADIKGMMADAERVTEGEPVFVVATQCLEVGADLDFDAIVTECASIDALLQRFGRLDRTGQLAGRDIATGRIVISTAMTDAEYVDPVYDAALSKTWQWIQRTGSVEFGNYSDAGNATVRERLAQAGKEAGALRKENPTGPVLLPAHLDLLSQTSPRPALEPDVSLFLHGKENSAPEVQVVWRADLNPASAALWAEVVGMCPPVANEAMRVPLGAFRKWLTGGETPVSSDLEGAEPETEDPGDSKTRAGVLRWAGDDSEVIPADSPVESLKILRPGDTLVLSTVDRGWDELGHIPPGAPKDAAEAARFELRRGWICRLHPAVMAEWPQVESKAALVAAAQDKNAEPATLRQLLSDYAREVGDRARWCVPAPSALRAERYPSDADAHAGWVLSAPFAEADAGNDESLSSEAVRLDAHLTDVKKVVENFAGRLLADEGLRASLSRSAEVHDWGKADSRFQSLLHGGDPLAAQFAPYLLAKGRTARQSRSARLQQQRSSELPAGFRHELVSLMLAQKRDDFNEDDLALHLVASHHGRCRPFAPVVQDSGKTLRWGDIQLTSGERAANAPHRLDSGVADRYWTLARRYGWWGLAFLETILRLGDWQASQQEAAARKGAAR